MAKNVVVTVDDYLMRRDPEKYKKLLEPEKEVEVKKDNMEISEIREMLVEVEKLEGANKELELEVKASYARNVKLGKENKKLKAEVNRLKGKL